jgi:host factor-I protein
MNRRPTYDSRNKGHDYYDDDRKKAPPPFDTYAEIYYYKKQIDSRTEVVIVLRDGEVINGTIEWYDRHTLKINRKNGPNILLMKNFIKYLYKAEEEAGKDIS